MVQMFCDGTRPVQDRARALSVCRHDQVREVDRWWRCRRLSALGPLCGLLGERRIKAIILVVAAPFDVVPSLLSFL